MKYRCLIFDFDGTLADSFGWFTSVLNEIVKKFGGRAIASTELPSLRRCDSRQLFKQFGLPMWKSPLIATYARACMRRDIGAIQMFSGMSTVLRELALSGVSLGIVTSNSEANVRQVLGPEYTALFTHLHCGAAIFGKAARLKKVLRHAGVAPAQALYIGDEVRDWEAARAAGMAFGAVAWGYTEPAALKALNPSEFFETIENLVALRRH